MQGDLDSRRQAASTASGGISDDTIYGMALAELRRHGPRPRVLDLGAGMGRFSQALLGSQLYSSIVAADLMPRPAGLADEIAWVQADLNAPLPLPDDSFDVIAAIEVIEHLENPRAMLRECWRLLCRGGLLTLTTPNNESLRSLLNLALRGHYAAFGPQSYPAHITPLLGVDIHRAAAEAGFIDGRIGYSNQGAIPRLTNARWQQIGFGLLQGRRFSDNLVFVCRKASA